jgi:Ca2+/Na+ antiporter
MNDAQSFAAVIVVLALVVLFAVLVKRRKPLAVPVPHIEKSPEQIKADRLAKEAREREVLAQQFAAGRAQWSGWFQIFGGLLMLIGFWFLVLDPGSDVSSVVNIQKLYIGQTAAFVGSILLASGVLLKYLQ